MASKGILVSDPTLHDMTPTRWTFEFAGLTQLRKQQWETTVKVTKDALVHFLGLDLIPLHDNAESGQVESSKIEYLPLTAFIAPRMFQDTMEKRIKLNEQQKALNPESSTEDKMGYDEMLENIDDVIEWVEEATSGADRKINDMHIETAVRAGVLQIGDSPKPVSPPPVLTKGKKRAKRNVKIKK